MKANEIKECTKSLLSILRLRNSFMSFLGVLIAADIALHEPSIIPHFKALMAAISAAMITSAGNVINDYFDFEIDKINKPNRPLPAGKISRSDALMLSFALFMIGLGLAKYVNSYCLSLAGINAILLVVYGRYSKKMLLVSNVVISYLVGSIFIFGIFSVAEGFDLSSAPGFEIVVLLSACAFMATFAREIIKDIEDMEGDKRRYAVTLPIRFGVKSTKDMAKIFIVSAVLFSLVPFIIKPSGFDLLAYGLPMITADLLFIISLTMNPLVSQRVIVFAMFLALMGFSFGAIIPTI